jgi:hypothetical protein
MCFEFSFSYTPVVTDFFLAIAFCLVVPNSPLTVGRAILALALLSTVYAVWVVGRGVAF